MASQKKKKVTKKTPAEKAVATRKKRAAKRSKTAKKAAATRKKNAEKKAAEVKVSNKEVTATVEVAPGFKLEQKVSTKSLLDKIKEFFKNLRSKLPF